tara:strand:- start:2156 stop:2320 length:165 start_codon:yes stop_codon:yes gene_type:complete
MERIREIVVQMMQISDEGRKDLISKEEIILRGRIRTLLGPFPIEKKKHGGSNGK